MAVHTLYFTNTVIPVVGAMAMQVNGTAPAAGVTGTGWTVAKLAATNLSAMQANTKKASGTFAATDQISAGFVANNCFRSDLLFNGSFAAATWQLDFKIRAVSAASSQTGQVRFRVWRSANPAGAGATQITSAVQNGGTTAALSTTASATSSNTWSPGAFSLTDEYLWVQCEWNIVATSGSNNGDALFYIENTAKIVAADFTGTVFAPVTNKDSMFMVM